MTIDFDGLSESLRSDGRHSFDIANLWTVMVWVKPSDVEGVQTFFHLNDADREQTDNSIRIDSTGSAVRVMACGSKGYFFPAEMRQWDGVLSTGVWTNLTATWNGTALNLYINGAPTAASGTIVDDGGLIQTDSVDKSIWFGENKDTFNNEFNGRIYSAAIWDKVLSTSTISGIADDSSILLNQPAGGNAVHWWPMGLSGTVVVDSGTSSNPVNVSSFTISGADEVVDVP
jgi:hypothetical protein